jgi:hypothetical protein
VDFSAAAHGAGTSGGASMGTGSLGTHQLQHSNTPTGAGGAGEVAAAQIYNPYGTSAGNEYGQQQPHGQFTTPYAGSGMQAGGQDMEHGLDQQSIQAMMAGLQKLSPKKAHDQQEVCTC